MIDPGAGIHPDISFEDYLQIRRLNNSDLKHMGASPAHYEHNQTERRKDTQALQRGRATSLAIFEPEKFRSTFAVYEDRRAGKEWEKFKAAQLPGVEILKLETYEQVKAIAKAVRSSEMARPYVSGGRGEVTMCWSQVSPDVGGMPGYRVECKGRLDFLPSGVFALSDVKTTRNAAPDAFGRQAFALDYCVQAAWYVDAYRLLTGEERPFFLVAVEAASPHVVQVYRLTDEQIGFGREVYRARLDRLSLCRRESRWPGYSDDVMDLTLPRWAVPQDEEDVTGLDLVIGG